MSEVATQWECPHCHSVNPKDSSVCNRCFASLVDAGRKAVVHQHLERAREFQSQGRLDQAIVQLLEASRQDPADFDVHMLLGRAYTDKNFVREAAAAFEDAVRVRPGSAHAHYALGQTYRTLDRVEEALAQFSIAVQLDPSHAGAKAARDELQGVHREIVPEPAPREKGDERIEIKPRPLIGSRTILAGLAALAVGLGGAALAGFAFDALSSPQLVEREAAFLRFVVPAMLVVWCLSGVACASVTAPLLPLGGAAAGLIVGGAGLSLASSLAGVPMPGWLLTRAVAAGVVLTGGVDLLARGTFFGERRGLLFWGTLAAVVILGAYRFLSQGTLSGYVRMQTPLSDKAETPVGGVELVLISPGGYSYRTTSLDSKGRDEGFYAFRRIPAGVHSLAYRRPGSARWWQEPVEVDYTVTAGTQLDLLLPDTTARTRRR